MAARDRAKGGEMGRKKAIQRVVLLAALVAIVVVPVLEASAGNRWEFGVGFPISTTFGLTSFSFGVEAYARLLGMMLIWETALKTYLTFDSLYIRNTIATASALFLSFGHVTNLLPYFGSTYLTAGVGLTLGQALVAHFAANLAVSIGGGSIYPFLEFRFQFGIDP
jgi:hypothetical protein